MRVLAQIAKSYRPVGGIERVLVVISLELLLAELYHGIKCQPFQALAPGADPLGPGLLRDREVGEQRTLVEVDGFTQGLAAAVGEQRLKSHHVARDPSPAQGNPFAIADERIVAQHTPQPREGLAQVLPRLSVEMGAP